MEEERVRSAAEAEARERELHEQQAREVEARQEAERLAVQRAEDETRREVERRAREEAARYAAIQRAATEAARIQAEATVRAQERERERLHAVEVEQARAVAGKPRSGPAWGAVSAVVMACLTTALYLGVLSPRAEARERAANAETAAREATITELRTKMAATDATVTSLQSDVAAGQAEVTRLRGLLDARPPAGPTSHPGPHGPTGPSVLHTAPPIDGFTTCPPGSKDPLCIH